MSVSTQSDTNTPFPMEALPKPLANITAEVARILQLPADLPGSMALATVSAALGKSVFFDNPPFRTFPNLYLLATAQSGTGKSAAFSFVTRPLFQLEATMMDAHTDTDLPTLLAEKQLLAVEITKLKTPKAQRTQDRASLIKNLSDANARLAEIDRSLQGPHLIAEDATPPKLASLLASNQETLALFSSEGGDVISNLSGRHNTTGRADDTLYLKGYSLEHHKQDRVGSGAIQLRSPCLTVLLVTTPDEAAGLFDCKHFRVGGLMPRFLVSAPETRWQHDDGKLKVMDEDLALRWGDLINHLAKAFRLGKGDPVGVQASPEAAELLRAFHNDYAVRFDELKEKASFAARHKEHAAKLALVIHCAEHGSRAPDIVLSRETMEAALTLLQYFTGQQDKMIASGVREARAARLADLRTKLNECYPDGQASLSALEKSNTWNKEEIKRLAETFPDRLSIVRVQKPGGGRPSYAVKFIDKL